MPPGGDAFGFPERNQALSVIWRSYTEVQKNVFRDPFFLALADQPEFADGEDSGSDEEDGDGDGDGLQQWVHQLSEEEEQLYRPLYNRLVDLKRIERHFGAPSGPSAAVVQARSVAATRSVANTVCTFSFFPFLHLCLIRFPFFFSPAVFLLTARTHRQSARLGLLYACHQL